MNHDIPILYSFRRCPYAMRARLAVVYSGLQVELREVVLKNKPDELISLSPKATVPVMLLPDGTVIDESIDIMRWTIQQHDAKHWLPAEGDATKQIEQLIDDNDYQFKSCLDRYKYTDQHPELPQDYYRQQAFPFLQSLEVRLSKNKYLLGDTMTLADAAIFPFIRQFSGVDPHWFQTSPYAKLQAWLSAWLDSPLFKAIMCKYTPWQRGDVPITFPLLPGSPVNHCT